MRKLYLLALISLFLLSSCGTKQSTSKPTSKKISIAFYNLENLFDTVDGENNDKDFLPNGVKHWTQERYNKKLANMSDIISTLANGQAPDVLGVCEVENRAVVKDLISQEKIRRYGYRIVHFDSPDKRGIDCALLYKPNKFKFISAKDHPVRLKGESHILTRGILEVNGYIDNEPVSILVGHWPSRSGGEAASMPRRMQAAQVMKKVADKILAKNAQQKVILMGDFNDDPVSPSVVEGLKTVASSKSIKSHKQLFNVMLKLYNSGYGTLAYRDTWNLFDNIVVSGNLIKEKSNRWHVIRDERTKAYGHITQNPKLIQKIGHFKGYPFRTFSGDTFQNGYSDHFPVYIILERK